MSDDQAAPRPASDPPAGVDSRHDLEHPASAARVPGARRAEYSSFPTGPVGIEPVITSGPDIDTGGDRWEPGSAGSPTDTTRLAPWALFAAIVALGASFFVGWGIPLAVIAVVVAIMSLRRPIENREIANWALVLGLCATLYSLGWLIWAGMQFERLG